MKEIRIAVKDLLEVPNICNQKLKEVWKSENASIAYVEIAAGNISLLHKHETFTEIYYLSGRGIFYLAEEIFTVEKDVLIEVKPGITHKLRNTGTSTVLRHLVISVPAFNPDDLVLIDEE